MIREVDDPAIVDGFANHPDIKLGINLSAAVRSPNVFLFGEHGGIGWIWTAPNTYEGHAMFTDAGRGQWGIDAGKASIRMMAEKGATHLWARVPVTRPEVAAFVVRTGMKDTGMLFDFDFGSGPEPFRIFDWRR